MVRDDFNQFNLSSFVRMSDYPKQRARLHREADSAIQQVNNQLGSVRRMRFQNFMQPNYGRVPQTYGNENTPSTGVCADAEM